MFSHLSLCGVCAYGNFGRVHATLFFQWKLLKLNFSYPSLQHIFNGKSFQFLFQEVLFIPKTKPQQDNGGECKVIWTVIAFIFSLADIEKICPLVWWKEMCHCASHSTHTPPKEPMSAQRQRSASAVWQDNDDPWWGTDQSVPPRRRSVWSIRWAPTGKKNTHSLSCSHLVYQYKRSRTSVNCHIFQLSDAKKSWLADSDAGDHP